MASETAPSDDDRLPAASAPALGAAEGEMLRVCVEVLSSAPLRATLAWTDPPTAEGADRELVNALGLMLIGGGRRWRQAGEVNTFEQISVEAPAPGRYHLLVTHESVRRPPQPFALVVSGDARVGLAADAPELCPQAGDSGAGTGSSWLLQRARGGVGHLIELESAGNFEQLLKEYDRQFPGVPRPSAASPLGFWAGDA